MRMREILIGGSGGSTKAVDVGMALLRVVAGAALSINHGAAKMTHPSKIIDNARDLGLPAPTFFGWMAAISECIGGALLALGLVTRPAAFLVACTMATAAFLAHAGAGFSTREPALLFLCVALLYLIAGSGRYGVDALLRGGRKE